MFKQKSVLILILSLLYFNLAGYSQVKSDSLNLQSKHSIQVTVAFPDTLKSELIQLSKRYQENLQKDGMSMKDYIPIVISILALAISYLLYFLTKQMTLKTNAIPVIIDMFREWRTEKIGVIASFTVIKKFSQEEIDNCEKITFDQIPDIEKRYHAVRVSHYFDNLGLLVYSGVLEPKHVISFVGSSAYKSWNILKTYIAAERELRKKRKNDDPHYQRHFEYFAALYLSYRKEINSELDEKAVWIEKTFLENESCADSPIN